MSEESKSGILEILDDLDKLDEEDEIRALADHFKRNDKGADVCVVEWEKDGIWLLKVQRDCGAMFLRCTEQEDIFVVCTSFAQPVIVSDSTISNTSRVIGIAPTIEDGKLLIPLGI